jgi:thiol-disulfide isomerase/thioredoxin
MRRLLVPSLLLALPLTACATDPVAEDASGTAGSAGSAESSAPAPSDSQSVEAGAEAEESPESPASPEPDGRLVSYDEWQADPAAYADSDVVLYFHATWCHNCQATDASLEADGVPAGLTLVKIDYDERTDLRQEYGVTVQHTFVKVDDAGVRRDIWSGTTTGADIAARAA